MHEYAHYWARYRRYEEDLSCLERSSPISTTARPIPLIRGALKASDERILEIYFVLQGDKKRLCYVLFFAA